ncbi:hypothetical protein [Reyranella sp.]|uniref:hypothetical protein n=1 Tax=Reyranella sp. TaxID=1929291 RepID=UPI003D0E7FD8
MASDQSVTVTSEEAKQLAEFSRAQREAEARTRPLPPQSGIPESAYPPGEGPAYVARMMARADQGGWSNTQDTVSASSAGDLPPLDASNVDPRGDAGARSLSALRPGATVFHAGMRTRIEVEQAVALGLLEHSERGGYRLPDRRDPAVNGDAKPRIEQRVGQDQRQEADLPAEREAGEVADAETRGAMDLAEGLIDAPVLSAITEDLAVNGSFSMAHIAEASQRAGISTEHGQALAYKLFTGGIRQATRAAVTAGVPADEVDALWGWAQRERPGDHRNAVREIAMAGRAGAIKVLAKAYLAQRNDKARNS